LLINSKALYYCSTKTLNLGHSRENDNLNKTEGKDAKKIALILRSDTKRKIVESLEVKDKKFSELLHEMQMTGGNLNYHLLTLLNEGLLDRRESRYALTPLGHRVSSKAKKALE
jgi:predicted transcriptional regulator